MGLNYGKPCQHHWIDRLRRHRALKWKSHRVKPVRRFYARTPIEIHAFLNLPNSGKRQTPNRSGDLLKGRLSEIPMMWKPSIVTLSLAAASTSCSNIAYFIQSPVLPQDQAHFRIRNMSLASVSRTVAKRVLATETPEVSSVQIV
jgi:hypothetical protein